MLFRAARGFGFASGHEFPVTQQVLNHPDVFAPHRTVRHRAPAALRDGPRGSGDHGAVDDGERRLEAFNVRQRDLLELAFRGEGKAQMHHLDGVAKLKRFDVVLEDWRGAFQHLRQGAAHLAQADHQGFTFFLH